MESKDTLTEPQKEFCGHITSAARKLGIGMIDCSDGTRFKYDWLDAVAAVRLEGIWSNTREVAFHEACKVLVNYLSPTGKADASEIPQN